MDAPRTPTGLTLGVVLGGLAGTLAAVLVWWLLGADPRMTWPVCGAPWLVVALLAVPAAYRRGWRDARERKDRAG